MQVVAAAGQTLASPRDDDSHRALTWTRDGRFRGTALDAAGGAHAALHVEELALEWVAPDGTVTDRVPLVGRTLQEGFAWLERMADEPAGRPEYEIPHHPVGTGAPFEAASDVLAAVSALYASGAEILMPLVAALEEAPPVRVWPHHFDMAVLVAVEPAAPDGTERSIGVGMAPMGGGYDSWYWYVTPWPYPDAGGLPELDGPGGWHTEDWVGAVLTGEDVRAADPEFRPAVVRKFIDTAMAAALRALG